MVQASADGSVLDDSSLGGGASSASSGGYGSLYAAYAEYADLLNSLYPEYTTTDIGLSVFILVLGIGFFMVALVALVVFFLNREVFEIRARSAYLVMLSGLCMVFSVPITITLQTVVLFDTVPNVHAITMFSFFFLVCSNCCYGSRSVRLFVVYNARARQAAPWLMSERNHVCTCLLIGIASLAFPLYDMHTVDGVFADAVFIERSTNRLWYVTIACQIVVLGCYVLARKTDDIFNIARELGVTISSQLLITVLVKLVSEYCSPQVARWMNQATMGFVVAMLAFTFSVAIPIHNLLFNPLQSNNPKVAEALANRKRGSATGMGGSSSASGSGRDDEDGYELPEPKNGIWTYEEVAKNPRISAAFDNFARKALCQESTLFLKAVAAYQRKSRGGSKRSQGGERVELAPADGGRCVGGAVEEEKYAAFRRIVHKFIMDGGPDEVNLSKTDKTSILKVYNAGRDGYFGLGIRERRFIFTRAYAEVRFVLEANLMTRFLSSELFFEAAHYPPPPPPTTTTTRLRGRSRRAGAGEIV